LQGLYEKRQWQEIAQFEAYSQGAHLVAALVLATARTGELVTSAEEAQLRAFHADRRKWLVGYLSGRTCDGECRAKLTQVMLSSYGEAQGDYDDAFKNLLTAPRGESGTALAQLHARLLWCQIDADDLAEFRDQVLVPVLTQASNDPKFEGGLLEDLAAMAALVPEPTAPAQGTAAAPTLTDWRQMLVSLDKRGDRFHKAYVNRLQRARRERTNPPPMIRRQNFCTAAYTVEATETELEN
jgi:hypothetical protein